MSNVNTSLNKINAQLLPLAKRYLGDEQAAALNQELANKLRQTRLQIMLFGAYNAGKSSLINALIGEEVAAISDIPKTATADEYTWQGCTLLDTPGVNAPIEHEELTEEQIKRSELMLFVIREGDQDVKDVYKRMFELLNQDKNIFIVFNHQLAGDELNKAAKRLNEQLFILAKQFNTSQEKVASINVIPVNIKTALTARIKQSEKLAEHAGIVDFESAFSYWLSQFDNEHGYLLQIKKYIKHCLLTPTLESIAKEVGEPEVAILKQQKLRESVSTEQTIMNSKVANFIRSQQANLSLEVEDAFNNAQSDNALNAQMQSIAENLSEQSFEFMSQYLAGLEELNVALENMESIDEREKASDENKFGQFVFDVAKNANHEKLTKEALLQLRKLKIPGFKGRWSKTFDKWAGKAAPWIQVGMSLLEMKMASDEEKEQNDAIRRQQLQFQKAVSGYADKIITLVLNNSKESIDKHFTTLITSIDSKIDKDLSSKAQVDKDQNLIFSLDDELSRICY